MNDNNEERLRMIETLASAKYENFTLLCMKYLRGMDFCYCIDVLSSALPKVKDPSIIPIMRLYLGYFGCGDVKQYLIDELNKCSSDSIEYIARLVALANLGTNNACHRVIEYLKSPEIKSRDEILVIARSCSSFHEFESADQIIACLEQMISKG